jgi:hypothetical protein
MKRKLGYILQMIIKIRSIRLIICENCGRKAFISEGLTTCPPCHEAILGADKAEEWMEYQASLCLRRKG